MLRALLTALVFAVAPATALATVTTETRSVDHTCSGGTSYAFAFPVLSTSDLVVTDYTGACGSATYTVLSLGSTFTAVRTSTGGTVTVPATCASGHCLRIQRIVPYTQETSFKSQGSFSASSHETAFDKLTMAVQQLQDGVTQSEETATAIGNHIASSDDHTMYLKLGGRSGGQIAYGGTQNGDDLRLNPTSTGTGTVYLNGTTLQVDPGVITLAGDTTVPTGYSLVVEDLIRATGTLALAADDGAPGIVQIGDTGGTWVLTIDEANGFAGIGTASPNAELDVVGDAIVSGTLTVPTLYGSSAPGGELQLTASSGGGAGFVLIATSVAIDNSYLYAGNSGLKATYVYGYGGAGGNLQLSSTTNATKGLILFGAGAAYDETNVRLGIGDTTPDYSIDVAGANPSIMLDPSGGNVAHIYGGGSSGDWLQLHSNASDDSLILFGAASAYDDATDRLGLNDTSPSYTLDVNGTANVVGATTLGSTLAVTGNATMSGLLGARWSRENVTTNITAPDDINDCGRMFATATDGVSVTLNDISAAIDGCEIIVVATGAAASQSVLVPIDPSDYVIGSCLEGGKTSFTTASHKGIYLVKASMDAGDKVILRADSGNNYWHIMECMGVWAQIP